MRHDRKSWQAPPLQPAVAVFQCRPCHAALTRPLALLTKTTVLGRKAETSLVPDGHYWLVAAGEDFAGQYAVPLADLVGVGYHRDNQRLIGCCGPSGTNGPNRTCGCGYAIGTERSDCIWPHAVYLDPSRVVAVPVPGEGSP